MSYFNKMLSNKSYLKIILKNPFRNKTRTYLAVTGIAIGIATIVALGMVTAGLYSATETTMSAGSAEVTVIPVGANPQSPGYINANRVTDIMNVSGVKDTAGVLRETVNIGNSTSGSSQGILQGPNSGFTVQGINNNKLSLLGISSSSINGTVYSNANEIIIGKSAAESYGKKVGDTISVYGHNLKITGIFESGNMMEDSGAFMDLGSLQVLTNTTGKVSGISVKLAENANVTDVRQRINGTYSNELSTTTDQEQIQQSNGMINTISMYSNIISILALIIGGIGVINTMIMTVLERTREIGVLKAVGWRSNRILTMILGESVVITLIAGIVGTIIGAVGIEIIAVAGLLGGSMPVLLTFDVILKAFAVAIFVGIIGGLYPAYRASKLAPTEALRYE